MSFKDSSKLREKISQKTGKSGEEITELVEQKKNKFSGLLTDAGATFMVAKELGVEAEKEITEDTKLSDLKEGMNNIDVCARVKKVFPIKQFDKNGRKGELLSVILWDGTAETRATFWNEDVKKFSEAGIKKGDALKITNCSVSFYKETAQLNLNYNSSFNKQESSIPKIESSKKSITDLDSGLNDVEVEVTIKKIFPAREFESDWGKGKVLNFIIAEGVNEIRATAWNDQCDEVEGIGEGEKVVIDGAYTKEGMNGVELHLGKIAKIEKISE